MTDLDAPSRTQPKFREVFHWGIIDITGSDISAVEQIFDYIGAGPPKGTGLHRYVFIVNERSGQIDYQDPIISNT